MYFFDLLRALVHVYPINFETDSGFLSYWSWNSIPWRWYSRSALCSVGITSLPCFVLFKRTDTRWRWGRDVTGKRSRRKLYTLVKPRGEERSLIRLAIKRNWKIKQPLTRKLNFAKSTLAIFIDWQKLDIYYKYTCEKMGSVFDLNNLAEISIFFSPRSETKTSFIIM